MSWTDKRRPPGEYIERHKRARILAAHNYTCHICGHGDAYELDHVIPWAEWTRQDMSPHDRSNLAPAHGEACPTCGARCHADKSAAEAARGSARYAARGKRPAERHPGAIER